MLAQVPVPDPVQQLYGVPTPVHEPLLSEVAGPCPTPVQAAFWTGGQGGPKGEGAPQVPVPTPVQQATGVPAPVQMAFDEFAAAHAHE
jgi:hypothetical protein